MRLIDLSHPFWDGMIRDEKNPDMNVEVRVLRRVEKDGINISRFAFRSHDGTHVDVPRHIIVGGGTIDQAPLERFYGTAVVLHVPRGPDAAISPQDLQSAQPSIEQGDVVFVCTGWSDRFGSLEYRLHHPYLSEDTATWLVEKGARMVGIDVSSVDLPQAMRKQGFKHTTLRVLLAKGIPVIHNLANLEAVVGKRVTVMAFPINFRGADGSPQRVVALVDGQ